MSAEERLRELGLVLPNPPKLPPGMTMPFELVRVHDQLAYVSGHIALSEAGPIGPFGRVGAEISTDHAVVAARMTGLSMLTSLRMTLGSLDRIKNWVSAFGMVNAAPDFHEFPHVINGFSELILDIFGDLGQHSRSAIGVSGLPFNAVVEIEAIVALNS